MSVRRARRIVAALNTDTPFLLRVEFIECLAAITALYPEKVSHVSPGPNRPVYKLLETAASPGRME